MKNNLINSKLPFLTVICSVICVILIRQYMSSNLIPNNNLEQITSETIVTTLSRGYTGDLDSIPPEAIDSTNNEDELFALNEAALIDSYYKKKLTAISNPTISTEVQLLTAHLPDYLMYKAVNVDRLKDFLKSRDSLLAEEPYLSTIISVSKDFNLNPLVMFAITGQEQSFVPKSSQNANDIANNPFNVFNSWKKYNTNIKDSSSIAARTIINLSKNRPPDMDVFTWVNRKYAEDADWSKAVRSIFTQLESNVSYRK